MAQQTSKVGPTIGFDSSRTVRRKDIQQADMCETNMTWEFMGQGKRVLANPESKEAGNFYELRFKVKVEKQRQQTKQETRKRGQ